ncbi:MAG TPA: ABC transporter ATP-binding protein [Actinomycetales bacterium]|nr:ABC transporter ATP-binding protein [Actinomycetales bacterium]
MTADAVDAGTAPVVLAARGLGWTVGGAVILDDITLDLRALELLAVIGPNGAGKSTLLHLLSGVTRPTAGRVELAGRDVTGASIAARARAGLGRTFQTSSLFDGLTAVENVRMSVQSRHRAALSVLRTATSREDVDAAHGLLDRVRMTHRHDVLAGELSHGDRRKLEVAVALARRPDVLLLDEPMAGVSVEDVPDLVDLVRGLRADGVSVCMVEHHMDVVLDLADRVAVLHHGELLALGSPSDVTADPVVQQAYLGEEL